MKGNAKDLDTLVSEARKHVWMGALPLSINLHRSEVTSLPAPSPFLVLAPRNGYLPLLADLIRPRFQSALPPGADMMWFDYAGLPLKWHIPTGVLFDLLCAEPERPWNLTVHFRSYPLELLTPCENEETVKWNFINAMKEASYIMYGSTKNVMNMSQLDQYELWRSVVQGDLENFDHISARLKPGSGSNSGRPVLLHGTSGEEETVTRPTRLGSEVVFPARIPLRLYIRQVKGELDDLYDVPPVNSWDELVYMTRPTDVKKEGFVFTLGDALMKVVPHLFSSPALGLEDEINTSKTPHNVSQDIEIGDVGVPCSHSDVSRGPMPDELGVVAASTSSSSGIFQTLPLPETDESILPSQEGLKEGTNLDQEDLHQVPKMSSGGEGREGRLKPCGGMLEGTPLDNAQQFNGVVRIQGIEPSLDLPLDWIARNLCCPEQFVHLCICTWIAL